NQAIAEAFLSAHPDFELLDAWSLLEQSDVAVPAHANDAGRDPRYFQLWPHVHECDGFFAAVRQSRAGGRGGLIDYRGAMEISPRTLELMQTAIEQPAGWLDLGAVVLAVVLGWLADRRVRLRTENAQGVARVGMGSVNRIIFPLATLAMLIV